MDSTRMEGESTSFLKPLFVINHLGVVLNRLL